MSKLFMLFLSVSISLSFSVAQAQYLLKGTVVDNEDRPLPGATIRLLSSDKGTTSDESGSFHFNGLIEGIYKVEISFIGYQDLTKTVSVPQDKKLRFQLVENTLSLHELVVTDNYARTLKQEEALSVEVVDDQYLKQNLGGSLMNSLDRLPGVSTIDIGAGQAKPVIRGLGFNRVVVVENNIKHEAQQWGSEHGLEIDQYAVEDIVVIKGPSSLQYGSDAIGGVIDIKNRSIPAKNTWGGAVDLTGKTNNYSIGGSVSFFARKDRFYSSFRGTIVDYADFRVPTDSVDIYNYRAALQDNFVRNTAGKENGLHGTLGYVQGNVKSELTVSNVSVKNGFFANAYGLEPRRVDTDLHDKSNRDIQYPYQNVNHFKVISTSSYQRNKVRLELDLGYQRNFRQEWNAYVNHGYMPSTYPDTLVSPADLDREFDKSVYSGNARLTYNLSDRTELLFGVNGEFQDNQIGGSGFIIPEYQQYGAGAFLIAKHYVSENGHFQVGLRYDYGNIDSKEYYDWFPSPDISANGDTAYRYLQRAENINRNFSNISWSVGYSYHPDHWIIKANVGKSFRMPIAKELAANGVNYHHFSFEVGDPELSPEESYQLDLGVEYSSSKWAIGVTPFINYFTNYIYLNPSSEFDRLYGNGNQVFYYNEAEVLRYGGEIHMHYQILKNLQLGMMGEYIYARQRSGPKKGFTLPFAPPASALFNIKYQKERLGFVRNAYVSVDYRLTALQDKIVPPEVVTPGFQIFSLGIGGSLNIKNQPIEIAFQIRNLFNTKYFNHTSYYRLINVPEAGRNIILNLTIPFSRNTNKN
ncbi:MAG TPA: TonB-dependent receptor [Flavobacteriales bacterium]|jgi:iron complex outermembrane receptor protein|nr:TonB-dependent receptor [Flavobacteriales bacterium]